MGIKLGEFLEEIDDKINMHITKRDVYSDDFFKMINTRKVMLEGRSLELAILLNDKNLKKIRELESEGAKLINQKIKPISTIGKANI
jgi:hypothetical protein